MEVKVDSKRIRSERESRGWSQGHLASVAGLSLRTIQRIEKTGSASYESATALASVFAIDVSHLRAGEAASSGRRAIRLSFELPLRLALAVVSGALCALLFRWRGWLGFGSVLDYAISGALFGLTVLFPYLRPGRGLALRAVALVGASALSYFCAVTVALTADSWLPVAAPLSSYLLASCIGVTIVLVAARLIVPLRVTPAYWWLGVVASGAGGAAMYAGLEVFGDSVLAAVAAYCGWHVLACVAVYRGHRPSDAHGGWLAAFAKARGRFSIVPGWMNFRLPTRGAVASVVACRDG